MPTSSYNALGWCVAAEDFASALDACCISSEGQQPPDKPETSVQSVTGTGTGMGTENGTDASSQGDHTGTVVEMANHEQSKLTCYQVGSYANSGDRPGSPRIRVPSQTRACFDPSQLLDKPRCITTCGGESGSLAICVKPDPSSQLLRITAKSVRGATRSSPGDVIFFKGQRRQLWQDVRVGHLRAPRWLSPTLPGNLIAFWK